MSQGQSEAPDQPETRSGPEQQRADRQSYAERLTAPLSWWLIAGFFLATFWLAMGFYLGWLQGLAGTAVLGGLAAWVLIDYGSVRVAAGPDGLRAGRARIEWQWVSGVTALDAAATRDRQRVKADARAYLLLRSYLKRAVEVTIDDPADPHPYWLVSCRRPDELARVAQGYLGKRRQ
ncbi:DUF3093 domain-containing protein [Enemella evansiae]|uniref:DUF3093 domain-containing protein n=1 Tax=Enemella evansiae TaxID=2016499 RepID=A0A255G7U0_9ACTN|nr:DUF3093 domain-containing protein [Enemella evansiae]OYO10466.1 hypothetical protein CGZ94_15680 [Enemella evansiae]OYO15320.1 hypothetical protein CGZ98_02530 [Enemella evansiae]OYO20385.1 hypothetical protein BI335_02205 [Enemella evansiae]TDO92885.1 hypothetical protein C8D81_0656 [Enemella evansiae]